MLRNRPDKIELDKHSVQILSAIEKKYSRDYLNFFGNLSDSYKAGPKKELDRLIARIERTINLLQDVIQGEPLSAEKSNELLGSVQYIEEQKSYWIKKARQVKALQQRIQAASEETGVGETDLNVSLDLAEAGVKQTRRSRAQKAQKADWAQLQGLGRAAAVPAAAALTGPFYPLMKMGWGLMAGKGARGNRGTREAQQAAQLSPVSGEMQHPGLNELFGTKPYMARGIAGDSQVESWKLFFDKEAYKAKWTKELLDNIRKIAKASDTQGNKGILSELIEGVKGGFVGGLSAVGLLAGGKIALGAMTLAATGVAVYATYVTVEEAKKLVQDLKDLGASARERDRLRDTALESTKERRAKSVELGAPVEAIERLDRQISRLEEEKVQAKPGARGLWEMMQPQSKTLTSAKSKPVVDPSDVGGPGGHYYDADNITKMIEDAQRETAIRRTNQVRDSARTSLPGVDLPVQELIQVMQELRDKMAEQQTGSVPVQGPRNIHDPGDTLLQQYSEGNLVMGER